MSFPPYPAYKPSGVEWLGDVPEHWKALPLRRLIRQVTSGTSVNAIDEPASHGQAGVLKTSCVYTGEFRPEENKAILESELDRATCPVVAGTLVVSRMNTPDLVGAAGLVKNNDPYLFLPDRLWLVSFQDCDPQFMNYWCKSVSYRSQVQLACSGTSSSMQNLSQDNFYSFIAPLPPTGEQSAIATFLDRETAKIDALIAEQKHLIELLQEKRQAVISHAVTKGLNPNAPMKDSGVEWLGEVPEHWTGCRFKHCLVGLTDAEHKTCPDYNDGEYLIIRTSNIRNGTLVLESAKYTDCNGYREWTARCTPKTGDIVFTREAPAGEACIIPEGITACLGQRTVLMHPSLLKVRPEYLVSSIYSGAARTFIQNLSQGATVSHLNMSDIGNMPVAVPPLEEQTRINEYARGESRKYHNLMQQAQSSIKLLQERRSALISAAVTGQIDIRGLVEAEAGEQ